MPGKQQCPRSHPPAGNEPRKTTKRRTAASPARASADGPCAAVEQRQIDDAIANGVWYLKDHMLPTTPGAMLCRMVGRFPWGSPRSRA